MSSRAARTLGHLARRHHHQLESALSPLLPRPSVHSSNKLLPTTTTFPSRAFSSTPSIATSPNSNTPTAPMSPANKKAKMNNGAAAHPNNNNDNNNSNNTNSDDDVNMTGSNHRPESDSLGDGAELAGPEPATHKGDDHAANNKNNDSDEKPGEPSSKKTVIAPGHEVEVAKDAATDPDDDWRRQPPYWTVADHDAPERKHEASCHCGRVRYWLSRDAPLASKFCHCKDCQSLHGAPFQWAAIFHKADLHFDHGARGLAFYDSAHKHTKKSLPTKVSCAYCHAPIMDEGRNMVLLFPAVIKFKDQEAKRAFDPNMHIFYSRRVVDIPDGKPKWSGLDEKSELMKDVD